MKKAQILAKVASLNDLYTKAQTDKRYERLAIIAAENLGGVGITSMERAQSWLNTNAAETNERGVVGEVNFCRDLVKD